MSHLRLKLCIFYSQNCKNYFYKISIRYATLWSVGWTAFSYLQIQQTYIKFRLKFAYQFSERQQDTEKHCEIYGPIQHMGLYLCVFRHKEANFQYPVIFMYVLNIIVDVLLVGTQRRPQTLNWWTNCKICFQKSADVNSY